MVNRSVPYKNEEINVENTGYYIKTTLYEGACELAVNQKTPKKDWLSKETINLQADRRAPKHKIRTTKKDPNIAQKNIYKSLNNKTKRQRCTTRMHGLSIWQMKQMWPQICQISNTITG